MALSSIIVHHDSLYISFMLIISPGSVKKDRPSPESEKRARQKASSGKGVDERSGDKNGVQDGSRHDSRRRTKFA